MRTIRRIVITLAIAFAAVYAGFVVHIYTIMKQPPEQLARHIARMPFMVMAVRDSMDECARFRGDRDDAPYEGRAAGVSC